MQDARYRLESYSKNYLKFAQSSLKRAHKLESDTQIDFNKIFATF